MGGKSNGESPIWDFGCLMPGFPTLRLSPTDPVVQQRLEIFEPAQDSGPQYVAHANESGVELVVFPGDVGLRGVYKPGMWTPLRVQLNAAGDQPLVAAHPPHVSSR